jgi:hypothetical protein
LMINTSLILLVKINIVIPWWLIKGKHNNKPHTLIV